MKKVVLGIGNTLNGDDGIGVYVADNIDKYFRKGRGAKQAGAETGREVIAIDCGTAPENYTSVVRKHNPDILILIDAADMGLSPGSYRIIPPEKIGVMHFSTHDIPLSLFISYVSEFCRDIVLIGIQPGNMEVGTALSNIVQQGGDRVADLIIKKRLDEIQSLET